jgi:tetratricopeptide (TPR) repeat protein
MNTTLSVLIALFLFAAPSLASAQTRGGSVLDDPLVEYQAQRGLNLLYNFEFEQANRLFDQIDRRYPEHPIGPFLRALNTWWQILLDLSDESLDEAFLAEMDHVIRRSDRMLRRDRRSFDAMFFKGAALGFRGRLRSNRGNWWLAARDGVRAMDYVFAVADSDPTNADFQFGRGIYDYYAAVVPERYPYTRPAMILFPRGNRDRGLRLLERTAREGRFIQTEAAYFLLQIYYVFEDDREKSLQYAQWLRTKHPRNSFFHTFEGRVHARWGDWRQTREVFTDVLQRYRRGETGYNVATAEQALYFLGRVSMLYTEHETALRHLRELDRLASRTDADTYFKVLGRLRQGMTFDAMGRRDDAVRMYRSVLSMRDWAGAHDRARLYLERPYGASGYLGAGN